LYARTCRLGHSEIGGTTMTLYIDTRPTLEWVKAWTKGNFHSTNGIYRVRKESYNKWCWFYTSGFNDVIEYYKTCKAAKAAAQADYEARTAERFRAVEVQDIMYHGFDLEDYEVGYNQALEDIREAIAKAKEQKL
jgi:hypothetical protein